VVRTAVTVGRIAMARQDDFGFQFGDTGNSSIEVVDFKPHQYAVAIRLVIRLAEGLRSGGGKVLIHCEAGVSRSCAAALIIYACWLGPGREGEAMERVLAQRPIAVPNRRMVEIADRLLDRKGCLLEVLG
jgi:predicted protein tyrosine phosphatase